MKIFFLGYNRKQTTLISFLEDLGHSIEEINAEVKSLAKADIVISFGYRHILKTEVIETAKRPIVNLHISYLPFNRGAHPNFWSWIEGTPSGVTIHEIDAGIDTGPIIAQAYSDRLNENMTFSETHTNLLKKIEVLFKENSDEILSGSYVATPQSRHGTSHKSKDLPKWMDNWDILIKDAMQEFGCDSERAKKNSSGSCKFDE